MKRTALKLLDLCLRVALTSLLVPMLPLALLVDVLEGFRAALRIPPEGEGVVADFLARPLPEQLAEVERKHPVRPMHRGVVYSVKGAPTMGPSWHEVTLNRDSEGRLAVD